MTKTRKVVLAIGAAVVILGTAFAAWSAWFTRECRVDGWPADPFEASSWSASESDRYRYVRDILERNLFVGADLKALTGQLGQPDYVAPDQSYALYGVRTFPEGGCGFNAVALLQLEFAAGRIKLQSITFD